MTVETDFATIAQELIDKTTAERDKRVMLENGLLTDIADNPLFDLKGSDENLIINSAFNISERQNLTAATNGEYVVDRWCVNGDVNGVYDCTLPTFLDSMFYIEKKQGVGQGGLHQFVEGLHRFNSGDKVTVSFDIKTASLATEFTVNLHYKPNIELIDFTLANTKDITITTTRQRISLTFDLYDMPISLDYSSSLSVSITNKNIAENYKIGITNVKLQKSCVATAYVMPDSYNDKKNALYFFQRFTKIKSFSRSLDDHYDAHIYAEIGFKSLMRVTPIVVIENSYRFVANTSGFELHTPVIGIQQVNNDAFIFTGVFESDYSNSNIIAIKIDVNLDGEIY